MDYKTELTTLATDIQSAINKANALPDAGSGGSGGGGAVETCNVTLDVYSESWVQDLYPFIVYTDNNGNAVRQGAEGAYFSGTYSVAKGLFVMCAYLGNIDAMVASGGIEHIFSYEDKHCFSVTGDCSLFY